jgi:Flp pilus assembly protein TadD
MLSIEACREATAKKGTNLGSLPEKKAPLCQNQTLGLLMSLLLILSILIAYWQVRNNEFIGLDDGMYATENPHVQGGLTLQGVFWAFTTTRAGNWHPLTWLSHMLDVELGGLNPSGHHMTSLLFHIANTVLLFWVLLRMTRAPWSSSFVAVLFGLHPLHVESVAWVAERKDVLSTFFWMLTLWAYAYYVERQTLKRYVLVVLCFILGLLSKPMLVTLPFVLLLLDYWPLGRSNLDSSVHRRDKSFSLSPFGREPSGARLILEKVPLFLFAAASSAVTFFAQRSSGAVGSLEKLPLGNRLANALVSYLTYIWKMIWPDGLAILYPHPIHLPVWQAAGAGLLLVMVTILVIMAARKHPYFLVGWLWYVGTLVPVIGLVQVGAQAMADRYTYIPLIGLFIMVAYGIPHALTGSRFRKIALAFLGSLVILILLILTVEQVQRWKNSVTLFEHTLRVTVNNSMIHNNLGVILAAQGKDGEARIHYTEALTIKSNYADALYNMGALLAREGKDQEAMAHFVQALQLKPAMAEVHNHMGAILLKAGRPQEAMDRFTEAIRIDPEYAYAHYNLGALFARQGRMQEAIDHLSAATRLMPTYAEAHFALGIVYLEMGKRDLALSEYDILQKTDPTRAKTLHEMINK